MATYKRIELRRDGSIELQDTLAASDVEAVNHSYIAALHDESATQTEYTRHREDASGATVPDGAIVIELGDVVDYLVAA